MLIGLCGGIAAGKDTTFLRAKDLYQSELPVERIGYADKMKESVAQLFGISLDFIEVEKRNPNTTVRLSRSDTGGELVLTFREFLQRYGTEAHRLPFGDMFWVDAALPLDFDHTNKIVFVTDVRFESEMQRVIDLGGFNILVSNKQVATQSESQHASETSVDLNLVAYTLDNSIRDDGYKNLDNQISNILDNELKLLSLGV